ncbi:DUF3987 domain-containing protein [Neobacillus cucumis]|uniref:DUF3987 domain-containing protein n=1 Tax=Neobacillus cucumis TaxID=1740721 RepID=UPI002E1A70D8|nr:DUF3987 domain-containing protein [Neobacillus cucumis]
MLNERKIDARYPVHQYYNETPEAVRDFIEELPLVLKEHVLKVGDMLGIPYEYPLLGLLTCSSICIGKDVVLKDGHREIYANIYAVIIGEQGLGKSPAIKTMIKPLREKDKQYAEKFQNELDELHFNSKVAKNKEERLEIKEQMNSLVKKKIVVDDETLENMAIRMVNSPKGLLWFTDEMASMYQKQPSGKSVTDYLVKAYDNEPWDIGRKTQEDIHVPLTYLTTASTTQPSTAQRLLMTPELQGNGHIARHLISVVMPDEERTPEINKYKMTSLDMERYDEFMSHLYEKCKSVHTIKLSCEAEEQLTAIEFLHSVARQEEPDSVFKGFHGKIGERIRKVALNLHMLKRMDAWIRKDQHFDEDYISKETIIVSYMLVKYLTIEALEKLFGGSNETEEDKMRETLIKMHKDGKTEVLYDAAEDGSVMHYVTREGLFDRVKRRFKKNRTLLKETLKNCPNLGYLGQISQMRNNGRVYKTSVFFISPDIKEIYGTDK